MPNGRVTEFEDTSPNARRQIAEVCVQRRAGHTGVDSKWMYGLFEDYPTADGQLLFGCVASRVKGTWISKSMMKGVAQ